MWGQGPAKDIIVYSDLEQHTLTSQKNIFGSQFLIQDSARSIEWRITNETRDIASFTCRKAVGKMLDSIYVIAFYTDQILTTGGPESFTGLPGMVLGIAIPRINTTWFATKLELSPITDANLPLPTKGKKQTGAVFMKTLQDLMKDAKSAGKRMMIQAII
jgi:GLPGLI family protein